MASTVRISITLPSKTLRAIDRERRTTHETRSEFFRRAVEELVRRPQVDRYVAGYVAQPETPEEGWVDEIGRERLVCAIWD